MAPGTHSDSKQSKEVLDQRQVTSQTSDSSGLDKMFQKMEGLGIPADLFGNINPNWRVVMRRYFDSQKQIDQKLEEQFDKSTQKIEKTCLSKYGSDQEKQQDCNQQAQMKIKHYFKKPKELSEIMLCNFANKCLIRGNTIDFCLQEVLKEKKVINAECLKQMQKIQQSL